MSQTPVHTISAPSTADSLRAPAPTQFVRIDGHKIAYRVMGHPTTAAPPLVFFNRFRGTMDEWDPAFLEALVPRRQLILFDYPGVSRSEGEVPPTAEALATAGASFVRALGLERVDMLGFSMGGYMCQILALTEPDRVRRVILCGASCFGGDDAVPPEDIFFQTATQPDWDDEDRVVLFYGDDPDARHRGGVAEARIAAQLRQGGEPKVPEAAWRRLLAAIEGAADPGNDWFARMSEIRQPVLVLNGDRDRCFPLENQVLLYRNIPNARLAILPMAGHAPQHQFPSECATYVDAFLD